MIPLPLPAIALSVVSLAFVMTGVGWQLERASHAATRATFAERETALAADAANANAKLLADLAAERRNAETLAADLGAARAAAEAKRAVVRREVIAVADPSASCGPGTSAALERLRAKVKP